MVQLADLLTFTVQRPVLDRTLGGLNANTDVIAPSIFTIVEGLGVKLESRIAPLVVIVVDNGTRCQ